MSHTDPTTKSILLDRLRELWDQFPSLRLAQLLWAINRLRDPFYLSDVELMDKIRRAREDGIGKVNFDESGDMLPEATLASVNFAHRAVYERQEEFEDVYGAFRSAKNGFIAGVAWERDRPKNAG